MVDLHVESHRAGLQGGFAVDDHLDLVGDEFLDLEGRMGKELPVIQFQIGGHRSRGGFLGQPQVEQSHSLGIQLGALP